MSRVHFFLLLSAFSLLTAARPYSRYRILEKTIDGCPCKILLGGPGAERRMHVAKDYEVISRASYWSWVASGRPSRISQARMLRAKINWILNRRQKRCAFLEIKKRGNYNLLVHLVPGEEENDIEVQDVTREKCKLRSIEDFGDSNDVDECDNKQEENGAGSSLARSARIVNGAIVRDKDWIKYNVKITELDQQYHEQELCSGSLIGDKWVLTAAHCKTTRSTRVHIGAHMQDNGKVNEGEVRRVEAHIIHPSYEEPVILSGGRTLVEGELHDIQILKLNEPVSNYREKIVAVNTDCHRPVPCRDALVSGYGASAPYHCEYDDVLRATYVTILGHDECHRRLKQTHQYLTEKCIDASPHICAAHDMCGSGLCDGDSGGPLVVVDKDDKAAVQVGISSYIAGTCGEREHPDIYTRVSPYASWIKENTDGTVVFNPAIGKAEKCRPEIFCEMSDECYGSHRGCHPCLQVLEKPVLCLTLRVLITDFVDSRTKWLSVKMEGVSLSVGLAWSTSD